jgi:Tetracyclin repressor-like, C-terminal domain
VPAHDAIMIAYRIHLATRHHRISLADLIEGCKESDTRQVGAPAAARSASSPQPGRPPAHQADDWEYEWTDFDPGLVAHAREDFPDLPPAAIALTLRVWGRMHGLMALEIYGHLRTLVHDPATVYRDEMRSLITALGLTP